MEEGLINKVAQSGLITFNLESYYLEGDRHFLDIKGVLFMEMVLKEKDFRDWVKNHNWEQYAKKHVAVGCSVDAIVPTWAYMLIASKLSGRVETLHFGTLESLEKELWKSQLDRIDFTPYQDGKIVVKGCSNIDINAYAYVYVTEKLVKVAQSVMYGEPCSTVPVFKKKKTGTETT
jgi:hypothetical protein